MLASQGVNPGANQLTLTARIAELHSLRYTPAGLPALDLRLEHETRLQELGQERQARADVKAVAFGALAESLSQQTIGSYWRFKGFVATPRNGKNLVFHIQEFSQD